MDSNGNNLGARETGSATVSVAVIDGPYDATALSQILAQRPVSLGDVNCGFNPKDGCRHGTFVIGLLGARRDALIPGLCPDCRLLHVPIFVDEHAPRASVDKLADAITLAVAAGARLINLSLAILGSDGQSNAGLAAALDRAMVSGAVVVVAAGNQGRLAISQLLLHKVTIPVVAVDSAHRPLPDSNFGPLISRRGVAALGHEVLGYAPGCEAALMSGTSVATAVATGTLALLWSERPQADGNDIRAAVARLAPRHGSIPPILDRDAFSAALDRGDASAAASSLLGDGQRNYENGEIPMNTGRSGLPRSLNASANSASMASHAVTAASASESTNGMPSEGCACANGGPPSHFIYVLGTVDIRFPDQSISEELRTLAHTLDIDLDPGKPLRNWYYRVLKCREARYVARQICWILKVEGHPAYSLLLRDLEDLLDLINCLDHPEDDGPDDDLDLFIGSSSMIPVEVSSGITVPVLAVDQFCTFKKEDLTAWLETPSRSQSRRRGAGQHDPHRLFKMLAQSADNLGDTDESRALNFLAVRYKTLYEQYAEMAESGFALDSVKVARSRLSRERHIVDPVFTFRHMETGVVQRYFVRVDVSHLFPMIVHPIAEYFER